MKRIYVTTVPLQGFRDLAKNTYRSAANSGDIETRFPILQVLHNTLQEGDDFHIIAIRSVNGDTQRNFGYLKEELQAMGFTEDHIRELPMRPVRRAAGKRHRLHGHHLRYQDHPSGAAGGSHLRSSDP